MLYYIYKTSEIKPIGGVIMKKLISLVLASILTLSGTCVYAANVTYATGATTAASINTTYGGYATYPNSYFAPDFTAVTGIKGERIYSTSNPYPVTYNYAYKNVDSISISNYIRTLQILGYEILDYREIVTTNGKQVNMQMYLSGSDPNDERSSLVISYYTNFPTTLTVMVRD
jgi:hypothetical protein